MQALIYLTCILTAVVWLPQAWADIYIWTDEDGVRHISNLNPPAHARVLLHTEEPLADGAPPGPQQAAARRQALRSAEAKVREREAQLARQEAEIVGRIEEAEQATQEALEKAEEHLAAAEASYERWSADRRYGYSTITYVYRPYGYRHHRYKHPRYRTGYHPRRPSLAEHPFSLGAIHLPLGSIGYDPRRYRSSEARFSRPQPHGGNPGRSHGYPGRRRP
jgi:hypothetical protein